MQPSPKLMMMFDVVVEAGAGLVVKLLHVTAAPGAAVVLDAAASAVVTAGVWVAVDGNVAVAVGCLWGACARVSAAAVIRNMVMEEMP